MGKKEAEIGAANEDLLARYFRTQGFYVARDMKLRFRDSDVTDVDVWLYMKTSPLVRERCVVDAKDRGRPKAMERILWARGIRDILGLERCIVATTDKRPVVQEFARGSGILVLDGIFLDRLSRALPAQPERLTWEEFCERVLPSGEDKLLGDWRGRLEAAKSRLLTDVSFDACVAWLEDIHYFMEAAHSPARRDPAIRLALLVVSHFLVGLDYVLKDIAFDEKDVRARLLTDGIRFGTRGRDGFDDIIRKSEALIDQFLPGMSGAGAQIKNKAFEQIERVPAPILGDYISRPDVARDLFRLALLFESAAFARENIALSRQEPPMMSLLGVLLDYFGIERRIFLGTPL